MTPFKNLTFRKIKNIINYGKIILYVNVYLYIKILVFYKIIETEVT